MSVLLIGPIIEDVYSYGNISIGNEDPVLKWTKSPHKPLIKEGGIAYIYNLLKLWSEDPVSILPIESRRITRHMVGTKDNSKVVFVTEEYKDIRSITNKRKYGVSYIGSSSFKTLPKHIDTVIISSDKHAYYGSVPLINHTIGTLYLDINLKSFDYIHEQIKRNAFQVDRVVHKCNDIQRSTRWAEPVEDVEFMTTSSQLVRWQKGIGQSTEAWHIEDPRPVDVCGAGDIFYAKFITEQMKGMSIEDSIKAGMAIAAESVKHLGCWIPER